MKRTSVTLRSRELRSGRRSLYLDIYSQGSRHCEYLDLYLSGGKSAVERERDRRVLQVAEGLRRRREDELSVLGREAGLVAMAAAGADFAAWALETGKAGNTARAMLRKLSAYAGKVTMGDVSRGLLEGFRDWLCDDPSLAEASKSVYFTQLLKLVREAWRRGMMRSNVADGVEGIRFRQPKRGYLTIDEVRRLAATPCRSEVVKRAFLFSCLTGLRLSDVRALTWGNVREVEGFTRLEFRQQKTGTVQYLDISPNAVVWMGERGAADEAVFARLTGYPGRQLTIWTARAGIGKHVTFHMARHTFAVMMLTVGVDIYTVSRLLGHSSVKTTQVYADIVDEKRLDAARRVPRIDIGD